MNKFDQLFIGICKDTGGLQGLLNVFFGFLQRRTDFYYQCDPGQKMGFPPGVNFKMVMVSNQIINIFKKCQLESYKKYPQKSPQQYQHKLKKFTEKQQAQKQEKQKQRFRKIEEQKLQEQKIKAINQKKDNIINTYNGQKSQNYSWSQETLQVELTIQIDTNISSKDVLLIYQLKVDIKNQSMLIKNIKTNQTILQEEFYQKILVANTFWKIEKNKNKNFLVINIQKAIDKIWASVFKGHKQIDTTKVDNSKKMNEFDQQTQGAIRKIMHEQNRKMQGLPTTEQQKQHEMLKKAWDAQGSPFKGTPFDPSKLNLSGFNPNMMPQ